MLRSEALMIESIEARAASACLVLMFKAPARSKRRLAAQIGKLAGAAASHLIDCALEDTLAWPGPVCYAPATGADAGYLADRAADGAISVVQRGGNLGERINHVNRVLLAEGVAEQLFIGIDCPGLDADYLGAAAAALAGHDVVLGPADDGGVVLMGRRGAWPDLSALAWSSDRLMRELAGTCTAAGSSVHVLEARADVDSLADLLEARRRLAGDTRPARLRFADWLARSLPPA